MALPFWSQSKKCLITELRSSEHHGLSNLDSRNRLRSHGTNELKKSEKISKIGLLIHQFNSPFVYILAFAALISIYEKQTAESIIIGSVIIVNSIIGFLEEYRAEQTISKLRGILAPQARVIREAVEQKILAKNLVPGDIIILEAGDRVPADARILEARSFRVNQSSLTGESLPAHKRDTIIAESSALIDRENIVYLSTLIVSGQATAIVVKTGMGTEIGKIAGEITKVKEVPSNFQKKLNELGRNITLFSIILAGLVFVSGLLSGVELLEMFRTTLALLVSIVPEGLPIALTVTLSVGLTRIFKHRALVRRLSAVESLGSVTTLCIDKTGTLTEGELMVEKIILANQQFDVDGKGYSLSGHFKLDDKRIDVSKYPDLKQVLELTSLATMSSISKDDLTKDKARELTDPTETALAVVAAKAGFYAFEKEKTNPEVLELPFDQDLRFSASIHKFDSKYRVIAKGSIERILSFSTHLYDKKPKKLLKAKKEELLSLAENYAAQGYRMVAIGYVDQPLSVPIGAKMVDKITFLGFLAMVDPIRPEARTVIAQAMKAGVRTIMITGDHILTATHIAKKVGLDLQGIAVHAQEIGHRKLREISVVARATPKDKLEIVERLQKAGEIVVMTGDGVNDAPALKMADIGVAMGKDGSDIAIETSEMVLLDDNIKGIVAAVGEGRRIWENIKKIVYYLVSTGLGEVLTILGAFVLGWPLPILVVQILWMNLVTNGVTSMALTVEPAEEDLLSKPPRHPDAPIVNRSAFIRMMLASIVMAIGALFVFWLYKADLAVARTATLTMLIFFQLFNLLNSRSELKSVFEMNLVKNKLLLAMLALAIGLQFVAIYFTPVSNLIGLVKLDLPTLLVTISIGLTVIVVDELRKIVIRNLRVWARSVGDLKDGR